MKPVLRWVGGKQRQLKYILPHIPKEFDWYHEPFFGGGAVFFALQPKQATINDDCQILMDFYHILQAWPATMITELRDFKNRQSKNDYDAIREKQFRLLTNGPTEREAARFYYLNKLSYNAMMRFNKDGRYNVPYGKPLRKLFDEKHLQDASELLKKAHIWSSDYQDYFMKILGDFGSLDGHVFYIDPPYIDSHAEYVDGFGAWEFAMLQKWCNALHAMGATVIVSLSSPMADSWGDWERHDLAVKYTADRRRKPLQASQALLIKREKSV